MGEDIKINHVHPSLSGLHHLPCHPRHLPQDHQRHQTRHWSLQGCPWHLAVTDTYTTLKSRVNLSVHSASLGTSVRWLPLPERASSTVSSKNQKNIPLWGQKNSPISCTLSTLPCPPFFPVPFVLSVLSGENIFLRTKTILVGRGSLTQEVPWHDDPVEGGVEIWVDWTNFEWFPPTTGLYRDAGHFYPFIRAGNVIHRCLKVVYYESIKRDLKIKTIYECRCMKDYKLKLRNLHASHTLGWSWNWNT